MERFLAFLTFKLSKSILSDENKYGECSIKESIFSHLFQKCKFYLSKKNTPKKF